MGILNTLFGKPAAVDIMKDGTKIIDNAFFTEQEKAEMKSELVKTTNSMILAGWSDNNVTRSITRRIIACLVLVPYILANVMLPILTAFLPDHNVVVSLKFVINELQLPATTIIIFYFGNHIIKGIRGK